MMSESNSSPQLARMNRILLTGAAGGLGVELRQRLKPYCNILRVSDIADLGLAGAQEEVVSCDLAHKPDVIELLTDVDAVVHMGGISTEHAFEQILEANIKGVFHLYEAARIHSVPRVVFASSNHVVGFHKQSDTLDVDCARRPDGYYGLSKSFGEDISRFYFDRYAIETACIRIGSSFPEPKDRRMLKTWMSYRDLAELIRCCLYAPKLGHSIVYGMSANAEVFWDNAGAAHLGFQAQDSSETFRSAVEARAPALPPTDLSRVYQGGAFVKFGPFE